MVLAATHTQSPLQVCVQGSKPAVTEKRLDVINIKYGNNCTPLQMGIHSV